MSDIKVFDFAAGKRAAKAKLSGQFKIGEETFDVRLLKDANIAYLVAGISNSDDPQKVITKVLDFMERAMTPESAKRFEKLALDPDDGLELEQVVQVFQHVLSLAAGGDPTGPSNVSSAPRKRPGARSTATAL